LEGRIDPRVSATEDKRRRLVDLQQQFNKHRQEQQDQINGEQQKLDYVKSREKLEEKIARWTQTGADALANAADKLGGAAEALQGRTAEALEIARELEERSKAHYVSAFDRALVQLGMGEKDQALFWLQRAYEEHDASVSIRNTSPVLDSVRDDPRFQDLLRRMNFPGK